MLYFQTIYIYIYIYLKSLNNLHNNLQINFQTLRPCGLPQRNNNNKVPLRKAASPQRSEINLEIFVYIYIYIHRIYILQSFNHYLSKCMYQTKKCAILPFSTMFSFIFWKCSESAVFVVFHLIRISYTTYIYVRIMVTASIYSSIDWTIVEKTCNSSKCRYNFVMAMSFYLKH